jgi:fucose permease
MKVVPAEGARKPRNYVLLAGLISIPIFGAIFYLTYQLLKQLSPTSSLLILVAGVGVVGYLVWVFRKARS